MDPRVCPKPGAIEYHLHQDNDNLAEFTFYENWAERGEWDVHMTLPHLEEFARRGENLFAVPHALVVHFEPSSFLKGMGAADTND